MTGADNAAERGDFLVALALARSSRRDGRVALLAVKRPSPRRSRSLVELVVGQAALVHARAGLVQLGLGALARGDLLGLLGARGAGRGVFAMGVGDLAAVTLELTRARVGAQCAASQRR